MSQLTGRVKTLGIAIIGLTLMSMAISEIFMEHEEMGVEIGDEDIALDVWPAEEPTHVQESGFVGPAGVAGEASPSTYHEFSVRENATEVVVTLTWNNAATDLDLTVYGADDSNCGESTEGVGTTEEEVELSTARVLSCGIGDYTAEILLWNGAGESYDIEIWVCYNGLNNPEDGASSGQACPE